MELLAPSILYHTLFRKCFYLLLFSGEYPPFVGKNLNLSFPHSFKNILVVILIFQ